MSESIDVHPDVFDRMQEHSFSQPLHDKPGHSTLWVAVYFGELAKAEERHSPESLDWSIGWIVQNLSTLCNVIDVKLKTVWEDREAAKFGPGDQAQRFLQLVGMLCRADLRYTAEQTPENRAGVAKVVGFILYELAWIVDEDSEFLRIVVGQHEVSPSAPV